MSLKIKKATAILLSALTLGLGGCAVKVAPPADISPEQEAAYLGFSAKEYDGQVEVGAYEYLDVNIKTSYADIVKWKSSNPEIATVDSNGRVDGKKEGKAVITAQANSATIDYEVEVTKAPNVPVSYSTAILANQDILAENKDSGSEKNLYQIMVNEYNCCITVFTYNSNEEYYTPVRAMVCSMGEKGKTPNVKGEITEKAEWVNLSDDKYYQYVTYIGDDLMFQSSPYSKQSPDSLITEEYNKIGTPATAKNIRLSSADAKWIYDNCKEGTLVKIVNEKRTSAYSPLGIPTPLKLTENSKSLTWDPTDSNSKNPYAKLKPQILGADNTAIKVGTGFDPMSGVQAIDTCGHDATDKIVIDGDFDRNVEGRYLISYYCTDSMGRTARVDREIIVAEDISEYTTVPVTTEAKK